MIFERVVSEGLAHYSYVVGDGLDAVVIDPRRDCEIYVEAARRAGMRVSLILETHRHEDYLTGSVELATRTGAEIWHADAQLEYMYGQPVEDGQRWRIGRLKIEAIHAPGHTVGMMAYLLRDPDGEPWIVFSGDALFAGDLGRVDLLGEDRVEEMAGLLYDTVTERLLPLGDGVIVCPAHGAGSVCGSTISERIWTSIGLERAHNPKLQHESRDAFIENVAVLQERPPYFRLMEIWNLRGPVPMPHLPAPKPLSADEFAERAREALVLDVRTELGFGAAHIPGAQSIWPGGLSSYAGWYLPYEVPLLLVSDSDDVEREVRQLVRLGFMDLDGTLSGGMFSWHVAGKASARTPTYTVQDLCGCLDRGGELAILDVRSERELAAEGRIPGALHVHVTQLPERLDEIPSGDPVHIFCGTGKRSMVAASFLQRKGRDDVAVILGGLSGWSSASCPLEFAER